MALLAKFWGYWPGYSREVATLHNYLSWAVLKAHTANRSGEVSLASADPRDPPAINFHYFNESRENAEDDLAAVIEGIRTVRRLTAPLKRDGLLVQEEFARRTPAIGRGTDAVRTRQRLGASRFMQLRHRARRAERRGG